MGAPRVVHGRRVCLWGGRPGWITERADVRSRRYARARPIRSHASSPRVPSPSADPRTERAPSPAFSRASAPDARRSRPPPRLPPSPSIAGTQQRERISPRGDRPAWRESHTCVPVKRGAAVAHVIFGGHGAPTRPDDDEGPPLDDAHLIDATLNWRALRPSGKRPSARGGHCAVAVAPDRVLARGKGRDGALHGDVAISNPIEIRMAADGRETPRVRVESGAHGRV